MTVVKIITHVCLSPACTIRNRLKVGDAVPPGYEVGYGSSGWLGRGMSA